MQSKLGEIKPDRHNSKLSELSPIGLALCRTDGTFLDINPAFASIIGYTVVETLNLNYWEILHAKCAGKEQQYLKSQVTHNCTDYCQTAYKHKHGHLVPVRVSDRTIETEGECVIWLIAIELVNDCDRNSQPLESATHCNSPLDKVLANQTDELAKTQELLQAKIAELEQAKSELRLQNQILEQIREAVICTDTKGLIPLGIKEPKSSMVMQKMKLSVNISV